MRQGPNGGDLVRLAVQLAARLGTGTALPADLDVLASPPWSEVHRASRALGGDDDPALPGASFGAAQRCLQEQGLGSAAAALAEGGVALWSRALGARPAQTPSFASRPVRARTLNATGHPGSLYRCGKRT